MTTYVPILDFSPPTAITGGKPIYSPDLFSAASGSYPIAPIPEPIQIPTVSGQFQFYEGSEPYAPPGTGYIQATLSGISAPSGGYWIGLFTILNASDRSIVLVDQAVKLSEQYNFIPVTAPPYYEVISMIAYTDSSGAPLYTGGGDQKTPVTDGNYIVVLTSYTIYTLVTEHTSTSPSVFSHVTTTRSTEVNVTVTGIATSTAAFSV